ncbi:MAG TPA: permease [Thermoleophilaceae bacterium]|nr:permease [Thermoleophilaceae bacterium]
MSSTPGTASRPAVQLPLWLVGVVLWGTVLLLAVAHSAQLGNSEAVGTVGVIFTSIVVEALPFILIGALVSGAIATYVSDGAFARLARLPRGLQVPGAALAGVGFPVCECGSVPVAKRLLGRGIDPAAGVAFMLAAPIVNPIVLWSTWVAYGARHSALEMTLARAGLGLAVAVVVGLVVARFASRDLLRPSAPTAHDHLPRAPGARLPTLMGHVTSDFMFMGKFLVLGAGVAALVQTALPQSVLSGIGGAEVVAILTMVLLAFALSLCSEADAFVAVSFTAFPLSAQLAFLVMGPAFDAKLAVLYGATFRRRFTLLLVVTALPITLVGSLVFGAIT